MSGDHSSSQPENALSVLLSALPSDVASSIEAGYSSATAALFPTSTPETQQSTTVPSSTSERPTQTDRPTSDGTSQPTPSSIPTTRTTEQPTSLPPRPTTFSTLTTSSNSPSTSSSSGVSVSETSSTSAPTPSTSPEQQARQGTIAGIATGTAAGIVLMILLVFFLLRRRKQGKSPFGPPSSEKKTVQARPLPFAGGFFARANSKTSSPGGKRGSKRVFPESAWLYDPVRTPPGQQSPPSPAEDGSRGRRESAEHLAPEVVDGPTQHRGPYHMPPPMSADLRPAGNESAEPLLAPGPVALGDGERTRDGSPYAQAGRERHSRSRSAVDVGQGQRQLAAIWEEGNASRRARYE